MSLTKLITAIEAMPEYEPDVLRLYRNRETYTPTRAERQQAAEQLKQDEQEIRSMYRTLKKLAPQSVADDETVWEFSL